MARANAVRGSPARITVRYEGEGHSTGTIRHPAADDSAAPARSAHPQAEAERVKMGQLERPGAQAGAIAPALGAGRRDMAERVGARVAIDAGVGGAATADRIEDDDDRAAQSDSL